MFLEDPGETNRGTIMDYDTGRLHPKIITCSKQRKGALK